MLQIKSITTDVGIGSYTDEYIQFDFIAEDDSEFLLMQDIVRSYLEYYYHVESYFGLRLNQSKGVDEILGFEYPKNKLISLVAYWEKDIEMDIDRCTFGIKGVRNLDRKICLLNGQFM